jgi:enoyl-CoA hydratase/carnithine racemase
MADVPATLERSDDAWVLRLDRNQNLFDDVFLDAVGAALDEAWDDAPALVTVGAGKYWSNGFDLAYLGNLKGPELTAFVDRSRRLVARFLTFPAPTVAAISGHAFGIGAMLALAHDLRVQRTDRGWFCLPESDLGLPFHPFMNALIMGALPIATYQEAMLTGRRYDGTASVEAGIASITADEDSLLAVATELAVARSGKGRPIMASIKRGIHAATLAALEEPDP